MAFLNAIVIPYPSVRFTGGKTQLIKLLGVAAPVSTKNLKSLVVCV